MEPSVNQENQVLLPPPSPGGVPGWMQSINGNIRGRAHREWTLSPPDSAAMDRQRRVWDFLLDSYFRVEMSGWSRLPLSPCLLAGVHSGTWLTMDAWCLCAEWHRKFGESRTLHGTAHDVLMALPVLGDYFRKVGVIPASRDTVTKALAMGHDVIVWPGGEVDSMRSWRKRDKVVLDGRKGFIRQAVRSGVPIVPVATIGGHDTVFVLGECKRIARLLRLKKILRSDICPLVLGFPFGIHFEFLPMHIPLPAKIRIELLEPVHVDPDPDKENDSIYITALYRKIKDRIQDGMSRLARRRKFPVFG